MGKITDLLESYYLLDGQSIVQVGFFNLIALSTMVRKLTVVLLALCYRTLQCICSNLTQRILHERERLVRLSRDPLPARSSS